MRVVSGSCGAGPSVACKAWVGGSKLLPLAFSMRGLGPKAEGLGVGSCSAERAAGGLMSGPR